MKLAVVATAHLGDHGAELISAGIDSGAVRVLGVATGSSPLPVYRALAARRPRRIDETVMFALDEYVGLPTGHPQTFRSFLDRELVRPLALDPGRLHVPDGNAPDLERECRDFEARIDGAGGIDLQLLGIGSNGHIGFNEPGSPPTSRTRAATLAPRTRADNARFFASPAAVPTRCLTQGLATIMAARRIVLVASGAAKARAIARAFEGPVDDRCPASVLQGHDDVTLIVDHAAAALLTAVADRVG